MFTDLDMQGSGRGQHYNHNCSQEGADSEIGAPEAYQLASRFWLESEIDEQPTSRVILATGLAIVYDNDERIRGDSPFYLNASRGDDGYAHPATRVQYQPSTGETGEVCTRGIETAEASKSPEIPLLQLPRRSAAAKLAKCALRNPSHNILPSLLAAVGTVVCKVPIISWL